MATTLEVQNNYSWLETDSSQVRYLLWKSLRFREKNYFHSRLYQQKIWDGFTDFFKKESGRFLTGLLPEVEAALKHLNTEYSIIDKRTKLAFEIEKIDKDFLQQWNVGKKIELEDYQVDLTNSIIRNKRGVVFAPTSAGKTFIMVSILKAMKPKTPALVLCNRQSLVDQNYEELMKWGFKDVGRLYDKYNEPNIITCATVQSIAKIEKLLPYFKVLVVDEIHDMMAKTSRKCYDKMKSACVRVAVSATPFKDGGKDKCQKYSVKGYFGPVMKTNSTATVGGVVTTKKLQERGRLSKANSTFFNIHQPELPYAIYQDAVTLGIANNLYFHNIVTRLAKGLTGRTLILVERLEHGDALKQLIPDALWVQGKDNMKTRKEVIKQLQVAKGNVIAIATSGIFNTGLNVFLMNLINAAGGKSEHVIIQRFGRGLRVCGDKDILNYYDFMFLINEYLHDHSKDRVKILRKEGHEVTIKEIDF